MQNSVNLNRPNGTLVSLEALVLEPSLRTRLLESSLRTGLAGIGAPGGPFESESDSHTYRY